MKKETPKGKLIVIGGAEDTGDASQRSEVQEESKNFEPFGLLRMLLHPEDNKRRQLCVITTASEEPEEVGNKYKQAFENNGFSDIQIIHIGNREEAKKAETLKLLENSNAVYFSGGDQFRLSTILGSSKAMEVVTRKYWEEKDFLVGGTSAGAMAMSAIMIYRGDSSKGLLKGDVKITSGLGLIEHCIFDTHFINRGRFGRLAEAVITNPACIGLGLSEDTALVISNGNEAECLGSGMVVVIDGRSLVHTNIAYVEDGTPVCAENLRVHILTRGNGFLLEERKFIPAKKDLDLEHHTHA